MTHQLYLKTAKQTIPVEVTPTEAGLLIEGDGIKFEIVDPGSVMTAIVAPPLPKCQTIDVPAMTPLDVIEYFAASPVLCIYVDDLKSAFRTYVQAAQAAPGNDLQLLQDVEAVNYLKNPSLADISEVLTGSRQYGGAAYKRVKAVKAALNNTTTTQKEPVEPVELAKAA